MTNRERAEELYEDIGGDLCVCQRADVPHWCEGCQPRILSIERALDAAERRYGDRPTPMQVLLNPPKFPELKK